MTIGASLFSVWMGSRATERKRAETGDFLFFHSAMDEAVRLGILKGHVPLSGPGGSERFDPPGTLSATLFFAGNL